MVSMDRRVYHGLSLFGSLRLLMPYLSDLCHTTSKCHQSIFVQVVPDDAHRRPFSTMSLTVDHLASCKYARRLELPHLDCIHRIHHCFFSSYNCSYLFISSSILPFHYQNTSVTLHLKCK